MFSYFLSNPLAVVLPRSLVLAHLLQQRLYTVQRVLDVLVQLWVTGHLQQTQGRVRAVFDMSQDNAKREDLNRSTSVCRRHSSHASNRAEKC